MKSSASKLHWLVRLFGRMRGPVRTRSATYNSSEIESSPSGSDEIQKLVREAGQAAASEAKAVGIPKVFAKDSEILKQYPDGRVEIIAIAKDLKRKMFFRPIKPGVLHARKK